MHKLIIYLNIPQQRTLAGFVFFEFCKHISKGSQFPSKHLGSQKLKLLHVIA